MANYVLARETPTGGPENPLTVSPTGTTGVNDATSAENIPALSTANYVNLAQCINATPVLVGTTYYLQVMDIRGTTWYIGASAGYTSLSAAQAALTPLLP